MKDLKPTLLLALAFFMVSAPNPDSEAIAEMTANFIVPKTERALQASMLDEKQLERKRKQESGTEANF